MRKVLVALVIVLSLLLLTGGVVYAKPNEWATIANHVVRPGETLWCIARGYGVSPWAIAAENGLTNPNRVRPGQHLWIPYAPATLPPGPTCAPQFPDGDVTPPACTCAAHHTVAPGSNLYRISLLYGVSMWRIAECNGILNLNRVRAGAVLCIPCS